MLKNIIFLILIILPFNIHAQNLSSLYDSARNTGNLSLAEKVNEIALATGDMKILADSHLLMGYFQEGDEQIYDATLNYLEAIKLYREQNNYKGLSQALNYIAIVYSISGHREMAINYFTEVLTIDPELINPKVLMRTCFNIGKLYKEIENYDLALKYYDDCLELAKQLGDTKEMALVYNAKGIIARNNQNYPEARKLYEMALKTDNSMMIKGHVYNNTGSSFLYERDTTQAKTYLMKVLALEHDDLSNEILSKVYGNLASIYQLKYPDSSIILYEKSLAYLANEVFNTDYYETCYKLRDLYRLSNPVKALSYGDKIRLFTDKQLELKDQLVLLNKRYQVEAAVWKKEKERIAAQLARKNTVLLYTIFTLLITLISLILIFRLNSKKKRELDFIMDRAQKALAVLRS